MALYTLLLGVLFLIFNILGKIAISISICFYFGITLVNAWHTLKKNETKNIKKTICFRGYPLNNLNKLTTPDFKKDYETQIENLHRFQDNYFKIVEKSRKYTLEGIFILIIGLIISVILNILFSITYFFSRYMIFQFLFKLP